MSDKNDRQPIHMPEATLTRLTELIRQREELQRLIDTSIQTARELLSVPADYQIADIRAGFVPPAKGG